MAELRGGIGAPEDVLKRQRLDRLVVDLERCNLLRQQHRYEIVPNVEKYLYENE